MVALEKWRDKIFKTCVQNLMDIANNLTWIEAMWVFSFYIAAFLWIQSFKCDEPERNLGVRSPVENFPSQKSCSVIHGFPPPFRYCFFGSTQLLAIFRCKEAPEMFRDKGQSLSFG